MAVMLSKARDGDTASDTDACIYQAVSFLQVFGGSLCIVVAWTVSRRLRLLQIVLCD